MGHEAHECKTALQRCQPGSRAEGGVVPGGIRPKLNELYARCKCHGEATKKSQIGDGDARTEGGEKIKVLNGACMAEINDNLRVLSGKVGGKKVELLRDTGCGEGIFRRELVDETDFTGEMGHIMTVDRTIKRAPMAEVRVDASFYVGTVDC